MAFNREGGTLSSCYIHWRSIERVGHCPVATYSVVQQRGRDIVRLLYTVAFNREDGTLSGCYIQWRSIERVGHCPVAIYSGVQ